VEVFDGALGFNKIPMKAMSVLASVVVW